MTRAFIDEHRTRRTLAQLSRAIGQRPEWLSHVLTHQSPPYGHLPRIDLVNALAHQLDVAPSTLLVALAVDSGLDDEDVTFEHLLMGAAFRQLPPERRAWAIRIVRALGDPED